jgi:hypothetical protein
MVSAPIELLKRWGKPGLASAELAPAKPLAAAGTTRDNTSLRSG